MQNLLSSLEPEILLSDARRAAAKLTRPVDLEKRTNITEQFKKERHVQSRKFKRDRSKRLWMAARKIANDSGLDFDKLRRKKDAASQNKTRKIAKAARAAVATDHKRRMGNIDLHEAKALNDLSATARDREAGPQPSQAPKRLTDQRDGLDRLPIQRSR